MPPSLSTISKPAAASGSFMMAPPDHSSRHHDRGEDIAVGDEPATVEGAQWWTRQGFTVDQKFAVEGPARRVFRFGDGGAVHNLRLESDVRVLEPEPPLR